MVHWVPLKLLQRLVQGILKHRCPSSVIKGELLIGGIALNQLEDWDFPEADDFNFLKKNLSVEAPNGYGLSHIKVLKLVHENLTQGKPPCVTIEDTNKTIELIHALYLSSEEDRWVAMTEIPQSNLLGL